ncbi:MAG: hypothetical protein IKX31_00015 [Muribaculaceae bacterium]|nr:hypothetical protein [Muribaculaceae bacterium]
MEKIVDNRADVVINHRVGCQIVYILICLFMIAGGIFYMINNGENIWYRRYIFAPFLVVIGLTALLGLCSKLIKERIKGIPALIVTQNSLIISRKSKEYNEIPFSAISSFRRHRVRRSRNSHTTYIEIRYNDSAYEGSSRFEMVDEIDCTGLNMGSDKLEALLQERLRRHNGQ